MTQTDNRYSLVANVISRRPHLVFFALAALQAIIIIPLTIFRALSGAGSLGWTLAAWHTHEMIFGFALAVMGGYFAAKYSPRQSVILAASWIMARIVIANTDSTGLGIAPLAGLYPVLLFVFAGLPLLKAAKTLRNATFGFILGALAIADLGLLFGLSLASVVGSSVSARVGLLLIVLMSFVMGGRITAAATSGAHQAQGRKIVNSAQISLEQVGVFLLIGLVVLLAGGAPAGWISIFSLGLAAATGARLWRWQAWGLRDPSVLALHLGFVWLFVGFVLLALLPVLPWLGLADVLHAFAIGAIGTFTLAVMTRVTDQKARRDISLPPTIMVSIGAVTLAAIFRIAGGSAGRSDVYLMLAAGAWTLAWILFLVFVIATAKKSGK